MPSTAGRAPAATYPGRVVLAPEGRRMLRLEARNSQVPIERKPPWIKTRLRTGPSYTELKSLVRSVELISPDFDAGPDRLAEVFSARPEVLAHNIETVPRIFRRIRRGFRYARSLDVLRAARDAGLVTKSNLILGLGEERHEVTEAMRDLRSAGCDLLTITQYLRPSPRHNPVECWVKPEEVVELREDAEALEFAGVMAGPLE